MQSQRTGALAETLACQYLQRQGLLLIQKNFHAKTGEIDLVMRDRQQLVFVEVRYRHKRNSRNYGTGATSITAKKRTRLLRTAALYMQLNRLGNYQARLDVVDISGNLVSPEILWIANAISEDA